MWPFTADRLTQIRESLRSPQQADRVRAMQQFRQWAAKDASIRADALPIFRHAIAHEPDRWTAIHAAHGIAAAAGPEAARDAWLALLARDDADTICAVAMAAAGALVPELLAQFARRPDLRVRTTILRAFGLLKDPSTFAVLIDALAVPELRADAAQSLEFFGDARAIPSLEACLADVRDAWPEDNHGPMLRVCDVAANAIERLRRASSRG